jgi:hypothetical protein
MSDLAQRSQLAAQLRLRHETNPNEANRSQQKNVISGRKPANVPSAARGR